MFDRQTPAVPLTVGPPTRSKANTVQAAAALVLGETLTQFTDHLTALRGSDDPEVVHQARVAWRRFKSHLRLFEPALKFKSLPSRAPLQPLLKGLGALRDLDVALTETLPQWRSTYIGGGLQTRAAQARRRKGWRQMSQALKRLADEQRSLVRSELHQANIVATLLALTEWANGLSGASSGGEPETVPLRQWARQRLADWRARFKESLKSRRDSTNPDQQHRVRILAKRLRYGLDALGFLLPGQRSQRWRQQAAQVQTRLGDTRDLLQAHALAASVTADDDILQFLQRLADQSS
jgi:CHAD domain-containing protein